MSKAEPRTDTTGRYVMRKPRKLVAISPEAHDALKVYAYARRMRLEDATEKLLRFALLTEAGERE